MLVTRFYFQIPIKFGKEMGIVLLKSFRIVIPLPKDC